MTKKLKEKNVMKYVVIVAILLIPFMYSFFYLKAFWNPYGNLDEIPVAIVNLDETITNVNKGEELVNTLLEKKVLKLSVVSKEEAETGLQDKKYYAVITIPNNFTSNLNSASEEKKQTTTITYTPNQKTNYLASQIISRVVVEVESEIRSNVASEVVSNLTKKLNEIPDQVKEMKTGIEQLSDGIASVNSGANTISNGLNELKDKYNEFDLGLQKSAKGSSDLGTSLTKLNDGLANLESGLTVFEEKTSDLGTLASGIDTLTTNHNTLSTKLNDYTAGVSNVAIAYDNLVNSVCSAEENSTACLTAKAIQTNLDKLATNGEALNHANKEFNQSLNYIDSKSTGLSTINATVSTIKTNVTTLKEGSNAIKVGSSTLQNGLNTLTSASNQLKNGINQLSDGVTTLNAGTNTLSMKTKEAIASIDTKLIASNAELKKLDGLDTFTKNSVTIEEKDQNAISKYGVAFAPYFISLSLWVGALMLFIVLYYDVTDRFKLFSRNNKNNIKRTVGYMMMATAQAIGLGLLLKLGLGFDVTNIFLYYGSLILIANTFLLIIEFLIINFNDVGKFIAILFLVLQLAASGGTFPIETVPKFFKSIYNFMPMKYSINLIKESIVTNEASIAGSNALVLICLALGALIFIVIADIIKKYKNK